MSTAVAEQVASAGPGRTELGTLTIDDRVVAKLAATAATEVPDVGDAGPRLLGRSVGLGLRSARLGAQPTVSVDVDGSVVTIELTIGVRWPVSVPEVAAAVRRHVAQRVEELTGLRPLEITIHVGDLITHLDPPPRVR